MAFAETLDPFFADFGLTATVGGVACSGIFDEAYAEAFGIVSGNTPTLLVKASVVAVQGAAVVIGARNFTISAVEPDGTGLQRLKLDAA